MTYYPIKNNCFSRPLQKCPDHYFLSFRRKPESSEFNYLWIPVLVPFRVFTGMTALLDFCKGLSLDDDIVKNKDNEMRTSLSIDSGMNDILTVPTC